MRQVGLLVKSMREVGINKFQSFSNDITNEMRFNAEAGRLDAIADMILDMTPKQSRSVTEEERYFAKSYGSFDTEEEYCQFWDSIDERGLFRDGQIVEEQRQRLYEHSKSKNKQHSYNVCKHNNFDFIAYRRQLAEEEEDEYLRQQDEMWLKEREYLDNCMTEEERRDAVKEQIEQKIDEGMTFDELLMLFSRR